MSKIKDAVVEKIQEKLSEAVTPITKNTMHAELKALGRHHFQPGGSGSETSINYGLAGPNNHYDAVHKILSDHGYKRVLHNQFGGSSYKKILNGGKNEARAEVRHTPEGHVYTVGTITHHIHY